MVHATVNKKEDNVEDWLTEIKMRIGRDLLEKMAKGIVTAAQLLPTVMDKLFATQPTSPDATEVELPITITSCVGKFITLNDGFFRDLRRLKAHIRNHLEDPEATTPLRILLLARPGSGKTFLVNQLAASMPEGLQTETKEYPIATMGSVDDLYDVFRAIHLRNIQKKSPFVFLDEVDAKVGGEYLFKYLLHPMQHGEYYVGTKRHPMGRAVLLFALSRKFVEEDSADGEEESWKDWRDKLVSSLRNRADAMRSSKGLAGEDQEPIEKFPDFIDRIEWYVCIPPSGRRFSDTNPQNYLNTKIDKATQRVLERLEDKGVTIENLIIACLLVKNQFDRVALVDLDAALVIGVLLGVSPSRRDAVTMVKLSKRPTSERFEYEFLPEGMLPDDAVTVIQQTRNSESPRRYIRVSYAE